MTGRRIKALGAAVPVDGGGRTGPGGRDPMIATLKEIAGLRAAEVRGAEPSILYWSHDECRDLPDLDLRHAR